MEKPTERSPSWFATHKIRVYKLIVLFLVAQLMTASAGVGMWAADNHIGWLWMAAIFFGSISAVITFVLGGILFGGW